MKPKRTKFHVIWSAKLGWHVRRDGALVVMSAHTKSECLAFAITAAQSAEPSQVRIHGKDGRIQEERTYPRSSDPRRTKG